MPDRVCSAETTKETSEGRSNRKISNMVTFQEIIEEPKLNHSDTLPKIEQLLSSSLDSELESRQAHDNDDLESQFRPEGSSSKAKQKAKFKHSRHRRSLLNAGKKVILTEEERAEFDCIT